MGSSSQAKHATYRNVNEWKASNVTGNIGFVADMLMTAVSAVRRQEYHLRRRRTHYVKTPTLHAAAAGVPKLADVRDGQWDSLVIGGIDRRLGSALQRHRVRDGPQLTEDSGWDIGNQAHQDVIRDYISEHQPRAIL